LTAANAGAEQCSVDIQRRHPPPSHVGGANNCPMTKEQRNRCQFCRFQKCLKQGENLFVNLIFKNFISNN
jgi:hypothetical protein